MEFTAKQIASFIDGKVEGDENVSGTMALGTPPK